MSTAAPLAEKKNALNGVTPVLRVSNLAASIDYYTRVLGFQVNWGYPEEGASFFASVSRGKCCLFLSVGDQGHFGTWVWIGSKDVEALHEEFQAAGAKIRNPPTNYSWALEMQVEDPDGNVLRFASDPKPGEPVGDWLDMDGVRWRHLPKGGYERVQPA
jgi:catechol 2,3-dioxygenase-like lactoylglutathione lyase family enzyme